jgi:hypothetical protein
MQYFFVCTVSKYLSVIIAFIFAGGYQFLNYCRAPRGRESYNYRRRPPSRSRSGRKMKGRGNMVLFFFVS